MHETISILRFNTSWGIIEVAAQNGYVTECRLPIMGNTSRKLLQPGSVSFHSIHRVNRPILNDAAKFLRDYFSGKKSLKIPRLQPAGGTDMQREVWKCLRVIRSGCVMTYGEIAKKIGRPRAARSVGQACGANPLPLFIPCHRVIGTDKKIGGFSGGVAWKIMLLKHEAAFGGNA